MSFRACAGQAWRRWYPWGIANVFCSLWLVACAQTITLSGSSLEPATVPLRAFPQVFVLQGELDSERALAKALAQHLSEQGHTVTEVLDEAGLRARLRAGGGGRAMAIAELVLQSREVYHYGYDSSRKTLCDSLGCFAAPGSLRREMPSLSATLIISVRVGRSMELRQQATVKTVAFADTLSELRKLATHQLAERLGQLFDIQRLWSHVEFYDETEAAEALDAAEDGEWRKATQLHLKAAQVAGLSQETRARLLYNAGLCAAFIDEGVDLEVLLRAQEHMEQALMRVPGDARFRRGLRFVRSRLRVARALHAQRAAAHHNFTVAGLAAETTP